MPSHSRRIRATLLLAAVAAASSASSGCRARFDADDPRWQRTVADYAVSAGEEERRAHAEARLTREAEVVIHSIEEALALRAETIAEVESLEKKIDAGEPLTGADLDRLTRGTLDHLALRDRLLHVADAYEPWLAAPDTEMARLGLSPAARSKGLMIAIGAALTLYDNYLLAISLFEEHPKLRPLLNEGDLGYQKTCHALADVTLSYNSDVNRARARAAIDFYEQARREQAPAIAADPQMNYFDQLIQGSPSYRLVREFSPLRVLRDKLQFAEAVSSDGLRSAGTEGMNLCSMLFGNGVGLVEFRRGKLDRRPEIADAIRRELRAGDILLEKTPFRLTDMLIPGHWGHVAIWLGTENELRALGIWDHPVVAPHHAAIREGRLVVEALRCGVEMNALDHFLNVDDMCVLRDGALQDDAPRRAEVLVRALRQVGKCYDFNFDVETSDRIVCSELCYVVYTDIPWPTEKMIGRATISPDHVARQACCGPSSPLAIVALYHDGCVVTQDPIGWMAQHVLTAARE